VKDIVRFRQRAYVSTYHAAISNQIIQLLEGEVINVTVNNTIVVTAPGNSSNTGITSLSAVTLSVLSIN
jgi:hypothetical protein